MIAWETIKQSIKPHTPRRRKDYAKFQQLKFKANNRDLSNLFIKKELRIARKNKYEAHLNHTAEH